MQRSKQIETQKSDPLCSKELRTLRKKRVPTGKNRFEQLSK